MNCESDPLYKLKAEVVKAVAHPTRLAVIDILRDGEHCVCKIAERIGSERSNISRHLSVMARAGVLTSRKDGLMVYYSLRTPCVLKFLSCIDEMLRERLIDSAAALKRL